VDKFRRYLLIIGATFGRGSVRPVRKAVTKVVLSGLCALSLALVIAHSLPPLPQLAGAPVIWCATIIFATQIAILFSLLPASGITGSSGDRLPQLLLILPLKTFERRILLFLPGSLMAAMGLLFVGPLLGKLILPAGMPLSLLLVSLLAGCLSAMGLAYWPRGMILKISGIGACLAIEYKIITEMHTHASYFWVALFMALTCCLCALAISNVHYLDLQILKKNTAGRTLAANIPANWFLKKLLRARITGISFCLTFVVALGIALFAKKQHFTDAGTLVTVATVLAAGFASDVRAITRRFLPAEVTAIKGAGHFVTLEILAGSLCSLVSISPLLLLAGPQHIPLAFVQLSLGISAGLAVSTLLVPTQGDITAQVLAGLCAVALTVLPQELGVTHSNTFIISLVLAAVLFTYAVEYKRNTYVWRRYAK